MREISIAELAASFEDDEVVFLGGSSGEATELAASLADPRSSVAAACFLTSFVPGINSRCLAPPGRRSRVGTFFMQPSLRSALAEGRVDFRPISYFGIHRFLSDPLTRVDTAVLQVSPPDHAGLCCLGPAVEFMPTVMTRATRLIGIVNPSVPRLAASVNVPMERFDRIARSSAALATYDVGAPSAVADHITVHLAKLIPDAATVQVGLGKVPSQLLRALRKHRELSLHTGLFSDAALELAASGALRQERSIVAGVAVGSGAFYDRLPSLQGLSLAGVSYTHAPHILAGTARLHAVNSALEVDLLGQVNAEMLDGRYLSGPGGLPDFARAAHLDPEGLSIIALNSTDGSGARSRIVAKLAPGTPVSAPQHDVDAIVTEYGVAMLRGQPLDERARRICAIAHPIHRPPLLRAAKELLR
jgi:acyl-CoA hydrolase